MPSGTMTPARTVPPRTGSVLRPEATRSTLRVSTPQPVSRSLASAAAFVTVALVCGRVLDILGLGAFDPAPFGVAVLVIMWRTRRGPWAGAALVTILLPLLVARCVLSPVSLSAVAPVAAAVTAAAFLLVNVRRVRVGWSVLPVLLIAGLQVVPAISGADQASVLKGLGVGLMWLLAFLVAICTRPPERLLLARAFVWTMAAEALVAMSESFLQLEFTRRFIAGSVSGAPYGVGPNLLLGSWATRSFGTIGHPIPLSLLLMLALVLVLASFRQSLWPLRAVLVLVLAGGVAATGARSAVVLLFAATVVLVLSGAERHGRHRVIVLVASAAAVLAMAGSVAALLLRAVASSDYSMVHRGGMVESAARLLAQPLDRVLFGFGYNAPVRLHALGILGTDDFNVVDNSLVTQAATAGAVGLVLLVGLLVWAFIRGGRAVRACIAACAASMFFFDLQSWHLVMVVLWFLIAVGIDGRPRHGRRVTS